MEQAKKNRNFGLLMGGIMIAYLAIEYYKSGNLHSWLVVISVALLISAHLFPGILTPLERSWMRVGHWLGIINSYIILTVIFLLLFFPIGMILKILKKDPLQKKLDKRSKSYWTEKKGPEDYQSMNYQF